MESSEIPSVVVLGDVNVDVVLTPVPAPRGSRKWQQDPQYREFRRAGGAWLVHEIVSAVAGTGAGRTYTYPREVARQWCEQLDPPCPVSITTIRQYPRDPRYKDDPKVYRMDQRLLGWMRPSLEDAERQASRHTETLLELVESLRGEVEQPPELVVVHDHNNGFRELDPHRTLAPFLADNPHFMPAGETSAPPRGVILWHTDNPLCSGAAWEYLHERYAGQTLVVVNVEDLREHGIFLKEDLSLEQTAFHFLDQLQYSPMSGLAALGCLAVLYTNGVMVYSRAGFGETGESLYLSFLPFNHRGGSRQDNENGLIVGYALLLVVALAQGILWASKNGHGSSHGEWLQTLHKGIRGGVELGLAYGQVHFREGFLSADFETRGQGTPNPYTALVTRFAERIQADARYEEELQISSLQFDTHELRSNTSWSRVSALGKGKELEALAEEIVLRGVENVLKIAEPPEPDTPWAALTSRMRFPLFRAGDMLLVDRREVDSFESISTLIRNYLRTKEWAEPLSIGVFGPPGSGKSFSVKQLLRKAQHTKAVEILEFNVAQFRDFTDLAKAFHSVQDRAMGDNVPFVLFDEFDSESLRWLKYFLAPMQDGKFKDGETTYQVGRAIFFFAGGTAASFQNFYNLENLDDDGRAAKLPDFVSRMRGYLNISGIDHPEKGSLDDVTIVRRAILLRAFIKKNCKDVIDGRTGIAKVDRAVIRAFLQTRRFEHGVRSMEAIVEMAAISLSRGSFQKSSIPLDAQLRMHVNPEDFLSHIEQASDKGTGG